MEHGREKEEKIRTENRKERIVGRVERGGIDRRFWKMPITSSDHPKGYLSGPSRVENLKG